ncbi:MAG: hypothetical protein Ta2G_04290 [Termitinemataceae bacterium]|nr:MAG: hypothetical protein Ta2G_04290 [Termitinemataceae bacterium]
MKTTIFGKKAMVAAVVSMVLAFGFVSCSSVYEAENGAGDTKAVTITLKSSGDYKVEYDGKEASGKADHQKASGSETWIDGTPTAKPYFSAAVLDKKLIAFTCLTDDITVANTGSWSKKSIDGDDVYTVIIEE